MSSLRFLFVAVPEPEPSFTSLFCPPGTSTAKKYVPSPRLAAIGPPSIHTYCLPS